MTKKNEKVAESTSVHFQIVLKNREKKSKNPALEK